ncbi:hypothetical protein M885DRAFT_580366 [Pelagophyceae sp. CCMP2097]|nr:hypothetical protein M885DRAFT_580366 [Pelagophyceae sp. CCMP2097]
MGVLTLVLAVAAVLLGVWANSRWRELQRDLCLTKEVAFCDAADCTLLSTPTAVEGLSALGDGHCVFGGGGDLGAAFHAGAAAAKPGAVWLVNATAGTARELAIDWRGHAEHRLVLHGVYYSQATRRLYAVNHLEEESVECFDVRRRPPAGDTTGDAAGAGAGAGADEWVLEHVASVRDPLFQNFALNAVVEGMPGEIYMTEWLPYGLPSTGKGGGSWRDVANTIIVHFKVRTTRVFRCQLAGGCEVASVQRFVGTNGLAVSADRQTYFVNDPRERRITVLRRTATGALEPVASFETLHVLDNIEIADDDATLYGGTIPLPFAHPAVCEVGLGAARVVGGRAVSCGTSPGGLLRLRRGDGALGWAAGATPAQEDFVHDGALLSAPASAIALNNETLVAMGAPYSPGVLVCRLPPTGGA